MKQLQGRVAVVTGAASGIGLAMAHRFAAEGMKIVLADIEPGPLGEAEAALRAEGAETRALQVDVSSESDVARLADLAFDAFGNVHLLCNNAGVQTSASRQLAWEIPLAEWDWILGVNFKGVLHGVRTFVPRMLAAGDEGHVVNTASLAGLITTASPYFVSKHAVTCLTEGLYKNLRTVGSKLSASVLCPGFIRTQILDAERNRPARFGPPTDVAGLRPEQQQALEIGRKLVREGIEPADVARQVVDAVRDGRFYVLPAQPNLLGLVDTRFQDILQQRNPTLSPLD